MPQVVVNVFSEKERQFYGLEKFWAAAQVMDLSGVVIPNTASEAGGEEREKQEWELGDEDEWELSEDEWSFAMEEVRASDRAIWWRGGARAEVVGRLARLGKREGDRIDPLAMCELLLPDSSVSGHVNYRG